MMRAVVAISAALALAAAAGIVNRVPRSGARDADTVLLLHYDGADAGTSFPDSATGGNAPHTMTANGDAQLDTAQQVYGTASLLLDGNGDYVSTPDSPDFAFGTGDFTWELWFRPSAVGQYHMLIEQATTDSNNRQFLFVNDSDFVVFYDTVATVDNIVIVSDTTVQINTWVHIAAVRASGVVTLYMDGTSVGTDAYAGDTGDFADPMTIGIAFNGIPAAGWIDELRISRVARYTAAFVPSGPF